MIIYSLQVQDEPMEDFSDNAVWGLYRTKEGAIKEMEHLIRENKREDYPRELQEWEDDGGYNCILTLYYPEDENYAIVSFTILSCKVND